MKMRKLMLSCLCCFFSVLVIAQGSQGKWKIVEKKEGKKIDILYDGRLMTSYCYYDSVMKPVLFPVNTVSGITVTRGWPLAPREGDHTDHLHHVGLWLNYESVNGLDFWNNSTAIPFDKRKLYGTIVFKKVLSSATTKNEAKLVTLSEWRTPDHEVLLEETTTFIFRIVKTEFIIDREASLTALSKEVYFKDVKDGFLGFRLATELEQPSPQPLEFLDAHGNLTKVAASEKKSAGLYTSETGLSGDAVWGTRAKWTTLQSIKDNRPVSITIIDHHANAGYPTYWHARGYGLYAANPLGQEIFSKGTEKLDFKIGAHQSSVFKYRIVVDEAKTEVSQIAALAVDFNK